VTAALIIQVPTHTNHTTRLAARAFLETAMTTSPNIRMMTLAVVCLLATSSAGARQPAPTGTPRQASAAAASAGTAPLSATIPDDPQITTGRFANGLRYYLRTNKKPEKRAELRLVVNAGSILEDRDQSGLAHFVEHMAFNGTKHFPKQEMVKFLESIGMRFGPSVNAFTSFDETVYMLEVPTDKPDVLDKAFLILEDWAHNLSFDPAEIDKERGVITEEWRLRRGAGARMQDKQFPILLKGSRYAERLPIGDMEVVQSFKHDRLKKFYADWYRPELMAVVAVGDFDKAAVETLIKNHFESIPKSPARKLRPSYNVPDYPGTLFAIATDKEASGTSVSVYSKMPMRDQTTVGSYRQQIVERLFTGMLSARFSEIAQKPDAPFLGAGAGRGHFVRTKEISTLSAGVKEDGIERGLEALFTEAERVVRFGFTATELDRQKTNNMRALERAVAEKENQPSGSLADEYTRNFTEKEPIPGIEYEAALYARFLPDITLAEINALAKDWVPDRNRVVLVNAPEKPGLTVPDEAKLTAVIASAVRRDLTAYAETVDSQPLLDPLPTPGAVMKTATKDAFGITEWELANGVKVVLKPTTFKEDEVLFSAFSPGGTSLASDADFIPAQTAAQVIASGGLGKFSQIDLQKRLTGKVASVRPFIRETEEGLQGSASRRDLETMFQLIYLRFTQPRADPGIFNVLTASTKSALTNQKASPDFAFADTLNSILSQDHPRARLMRLEMVDQMNLEKSLAFYKDRFSDASDFTFVFVGSFDSDTMKPLVERYLGALPATHRQETWKDIGVRPPTGVVEKRVDKGLEPKSRAQLVFSGPFQYNQVQRVAIRAMAQALEIRLRESLREDLGGTYSASASASYTKIPREEYTITIGFGCSPDRTDELVKGVFKEIDQLKTNGPTDKQVSDVKETFLRDQETNMKQNGYLLTQIANRYQLSEDLTSLFNMADFYNKIDAATIKDAARLYLKNDNFVKVTLFPEKAAAPDVFEFLATAAAR
jgi:zinc protease